MLGDGRWPLIELHYLILCIGRLNAVLINFLVYFSLRAGIWLCNNV